MRMTAACVPIFLVTAGAIAGPDLLVNGDFESGEGAPEGWTFQVWSRKPSKGAFRRVTEARSGEKAVQLVGIENAGEEAVRGLLNSPPIGEAPGAAVFIHEKR